MTTPHTHGTHTSHSHILRVSRLEGLTDGIFAIAMTILVLYLKLPSGISAANLSSTLIHHISVTLFIYMGSFIILGTLWIGMNFQLGLLERVTRPYLWANVFYLMVVCIVPFSANMMAHYPKSVVSISFFAINLICTSLGQLLTMQSAHKYDLYNQMYTHAIHAAILRRIYVGPICYMGALIVAHWDTTIAFILLVSPPLIYIFPGKVDTYDK